MALWIMKRVKAVESGRTAVCLNVAKYFQSSEALGNLLKMWLLHCHFFSNSTSKTRKLAPLQERKMIDRFRLWAKGGDGGNGCCSFRRSRHDRIGRPDGGNGGRGGDVILECSAAVWDFSGLQHHINGKRGGHGASKNMIGSRGADKIVHVPVGTVIHLVRGNIPTVVERSSKDLDPWEMPGALDFPESVGPSLSGESGSVKADKIMDVDDDSASCYRPHTKKESASINQVLLISSIASLAPSSACGDKCMGHREQSREEGYREWDGIDIDNDMSEKEGEEMAEEECIQFNVAEFTKPGERFLVAQGGDGGLGNVCYRKANRSRYVGNYGAQKDTDLDHEASDDDQHLSLRTGLPGSEVVLTLELKSIADVGLVGVPNAGKSTLLGTISRAKPVVGHYAFTTLRPNLGNLNYDDFSVTVADIPGLVRGAHENRGLGHAFLRHIERTKVLAYVVDLAASLDGNKGIPPWEQLKDLMLELEFYRKGLSNRPCLVVANKIDEAGAEDVYEELRRRVTGVSIYPVCAVLEEGVEELRAGLLTLVNGGESRRLNLDDILLD